LFFEPFMSCLGFHGTKERMSLKFGNLMGIHFSVVCMDCI
jgi:hypothetical protein